MDAVQHDMGVADQSSAGARQGNNGSNCSPVVPSIDDDNAQRLASLRIEHDAALCKLKEMGHLAKELSRRVNAVEDAVEHSEGNMLSKDLAPYGSCIMLGYIMVMSVAFSAAYVIANALTPGSHLYQQKGGYFTRQTHCGSAIPRDEKPWPKRGKGLSLPYESSSVLAVSRHIYTAGATVGLIRTNALQSTFFAITSTFCVILAAAIPTAVVSFWPELVHADFIVRGTLSNLGHDISLPRGRVFTTMLFTGSLLSIVSGHTFFIYLNWFPNTRTKVDVFFATYQSPMERIARAAWIVLPNVFLMFTAALPSLTRNQGTNAILTIIHNIAAPCSLIIAGSMEAVQLGYGENAFTYFFCGDEYASWFGALDGVQRFRVIILGYAWIAGFSFLGMQFYLHGLPVLGVKIKTSYTFALCSLYAEISALILAYILPSIAAIQYLYVTLHSSHVFEVAASMEIVPAPGIYIGGLNSTVESVNMSQHFLHPARHTNIAKQLRAGADGIPLF